MIPMEGGPLGPLLPHDLTEFIVGIVLFIIIFVVILKVVAPRFEAMYAARTEAIEGGLEKAETAQKEAEEALAKYNEQLSHAREEAARIREEAKNQGAQILSEMREQANQEYARIIASGQTQIEAERQQAAVSLRNEIGGMATTLAGRIVGETLDDDERARRTVDRFLVDLESQGATQA